MKLSVIMPMYQEAWRIGPTLSDVVCFIQKHPGWIDEVIVVDDGSRDSSIERAMYFSDRLPLRIERLMQNEGKWSAIRHGISVAKNDAILILDADGAASIFELERIKNLRGQVRARRAIWGNRFSELSVVEGKSLLRSVVSQGYRLYVSCSYRIAAGYWPVIQDFQCPLKLIYKSRFDRPLVAERFSGDLDLALALDCMVMNHPVNFMHKAGGSIRLKTVWSMAVETVRVVRFQRKFDKLRSSLSDVNIVPPKSI